MKTIGQRTWRAAVGVIIAAAVALALTGCGYRYPHACDGHGGILELYKGTYFCKDGSFVGSGWLWLHSGDPRARS